ncbi:MAG TPA: hypothetical protein VMA98_04425 [Candidatus Acidoferrales bacterium]|nr:hypothetical protein [Candidatus Acidoferrales bacterium]
MVQDWNVVAQIAAGASATLLGLLFVAVQLNREWIVKQAALRGRTIQTLLIFMLPLIASVVLAIPHQSVRVLGGELVVIDCLYGTGLVVVSRMNKAITPLDRLRNIGPPGLLTTLVTLISGATLVCGQSSGLYWLVAAIVLALIGGVGDAWMLLMGDVVVEGGRPRY